jgi:hypothetical protein
MKLDQDPKDTLDRLWAATRPQEPCPDAFDRLWAAVCDRAAQPDILPFAPTVSWKRWGLALAVTAQAAALLIAAFVALKQPDAPQIAQKPKAQSSPSLVEDRQSPPILHDYQLALGTTVFVNLEGRGVVKAVKVRPQMPESDTDVVTAETEVLNFMESYE